jgi:hypothetical protein
MGSRTCESSGLSALSPTHNAFIRLLRLIRESIKATFGGSRVELQALPGFGPDVTDRFSYTWWNTPPAGQVWIERRGEWVKGRIIGRGRFYVAVEITDRRGRRRRVKRRYEELRRCR